MKDFYIKPDLNQIDYLILLSINNELSYFLRCYDLRKHYHLWMLFAYFYHNFYN